MGVGVGEATMLLREGHCKMNHSCTGGRKHDEVLNMKYTGHIRTILYLRITGG